MRRWLVLFGIGLTTLVWADRPITVTFLHNNDLHAHLEPTSIARKPYGGYARVATLVKRHRASDPNVVFLNGGDTFQGTIYFNVYEGLADLAVLNEMGLQAMAVGNHEFDKGPNVLATFIKNANFPVLSSNLSFAANEPLKDLVKPYTVLEVGGEKVGVVGATVEGLANISSPGPTVTELPLVSSIQKSVDELTRQGVNKIVLLTHCGYSEDIATARQLRNVDLIVGGHSHSPLGVPDIAGWPKPVGPYPTIVKDATGRNVYVVQAWDWGKVLGRIKIDFDEKGEVIRVPEAAVIPVDESIPEDPTVKSMVAAFNRPVAAQANAVVGESTAELTRDATMGYVVADAMLAATSKQGSVAAFINRGGVRSGMDAGPITYGEAISVTPFNNTLVLLTLSGQEILDALKQGWGTGGQLIPSQGFKYSVTNGIATATLNGSPIDPAKSYITTFVGFTANGGDSMFVLRDARGTRTDTGIVDIDALIDFVKKNNPLKPDPLPRIGG